MADMRQCIGSAKFGIEAHEAPVGDFPIQPSQKDGLGRMCKPHWREYTNALRKAALVSKASAAIGVESEVVTEVSTKRFPRVAKAKQQPIVGEAPASTAAQPRSARIPKRAGAQFPVGGSQGDVG